MRLVQKYRTDKTGGEELLEVMEAYRKETPFFFKGDITDLSYFWQGKALDLKSLEKLPEEDQLLIRLRFYGGKTQSDTAKLLHTTQVQISRRERKILKVMRDRLLDE